jgi:hypothetical protein
VVRRIAKVGDLRLKKKTLEAWGAITIKGVQKREEESGARPDPSSA